MLLEVWPQLSKPVCRILNESLVVFTFWIVNQKVLSGLTKKDVKTLWES